MSTNPLLLPGTPKKQVRYVAKKTSGINARTVGTFYFYLEALWVFLFAVSILAIIIGTQEGSESYRTAIFFTAFHIIALPQAMLYAFDDGKRWIILCFVMCIITDTSSLLDNLLHFSDPHLYQWAWILLIIVPAFGLFISLYGTIWYLVVWAYGYRFKEKKHKNEILIPYDGKEL